MKFPLPLRFLPFIFTATSLLSAGLLFVSEPMIGKLLLPVFGGTSAVWTACIVFFQAVLLLGYAYAHWATSRLGLKRQPLIHVALLLVPLIVLPFALPAWNVSGGETPIITITAMLAVIVGAPFFVLAASGPLLQRYFTATSHPRAKNPYFLYAAGNVGSFLALLSYPFIIEPSITLKQQASIWTYGYIVFVLLMATCILMLRHYYKPAPASEKTRPQANITTKLRLKWLGLAFIPSSLMLGITAHITTDIAAVPLLWIMPLALYLMTFVVAFGVKDPAEVGRQVTPFVAAGLFAVAMVSIFNFGSSAIFLAGLYMAVFTLIALCSHSWLSASRPKPYYLTEFYLWVAIGGVAGGLFNSVVAPIIFNDIYELPIVLLLAALLLSKTTSAGSFSLKKNLWGFALTPVILYLFIYFCGKHQALDITAIIATLIIPLILIIVFLWRRELLPPFGIGMLFVLVVPIIVLAHQHNIYTKRTFYAVLKVKQQGNTRILYNGVIVHGAQYTDPALAKQPLTYYSQTGPVGDIMALCRNLTSCHSIASIGLGTGTLAAYGQTGDHIAFYEIDPADISLASNPRYFSYLHDSPADVKTIPGDGRLGLEKTKTKYDLLVIDAFSSDSIPTHLLTRQAMQLYQSRLNPNGLLAFHITNRSVNLEPVLYAAELDQKMHGSIRKDVNTDGIPHSGSVWAVLSRKEIDKDALPNQQLWQPLGGRKVRVWTDDYSNILDVL